jgi:hypothetical protein
VVNTIVEPLATTVLPTGDWLTTYIGKLGSVPSTGESTGVKPSAVNNSLAEVSKTPPVAEVVTSGRKACNLSIGVAVVFGKPPDGVGVGEAEFIADCDADGTAVTQTALGD